LAKVMILTTILLKRFTRGSAQPAVSGKTAPDKKQDISLLIQDTEEEIAVAISVALVHLRSADVRRGDLGATLEAGRGPWWMTGKTQQRSVNISRITH